MKKMRLSSTIIILAVIQLTLITAFSQAVCAADFGDLIETLGTAPVNYSNIATAEYVDFIFDQEGVIADGEWRTGNGNALYDWATHSSPVGAAHWEKGFWGFYKTEDNVLMMVDFLYNEGCYAISRFEASFKGYTWDGPNHIMASTLRMPSQVPVPGAVWLFGTAIVGLIGRRKLTGGVK